MRMRAGYSWRFSNAAAILWCITVTALMLAALTWGAAP
jgi:hypothetical protein